MNFSARNVMSGISQKTDVLKEVSPEEREKLKNTLLQIMQHIHDVCGKYNTEYSLHGGTALGAIRHEGYIPWDDDLDIVMLRKGWERFKSIFDEALGDKYVLEGPNYGNKETKTYFGKIYKKGTRLVEIQDINAPFEKGIYVDIFIFDNVSDNKLIRWYDSIVSDFIKGVTTSQIYYKYPNKVMKTYMGTTRKSKIYYSMRRILGFFFSFVSHRKLVAWYDHFVSRHNDSTNNITVPAGREYYKGEIMPRSSWAPLKLMKFEDRFFYCQADVVGYCRQHYGPTYMELPPLEKRERHFCVELDFGDN